jgi:hypothetical protein
MICAGETRVARKKIITPPLAIPAARLGLDKGRDQCVCIQRARISSGESLHELERGSTPSLFLGYSIGPIVSFLETRVVIPADVTHCWERGYHGDRLLQRNPTPHRFGFLCFFSPRGGILLSDITDQQELEKQTHSEPPP